MRFMQTEELTQKQYEILQYVFNYMLDNPTAPSMREIQEAFSYQAVSTVRDHIAALTRKGFVTSTGQHRGLRLNPKKTNQLFGVPLLAGIGAGAPTFLDDEIIRFITPEEGIPKNADYGFVVRGESMSPTIEPGDEVFIHEDAGELREGIVVVTIKDEYGVIQGVIKRLIRQNSTWLLISDNPTHPQYKLDEVEIFGRVVEVRRRLDHG